jgi:uridine kinase
MNELQEKMIEETEENFENTDPQKRDCVTITINDGSEHKLEQGQPISTLVDKLPRENGLPYICAKVINDIQGLDFVPEMDCKIEFLNYQTPHGRDCYRRSLTFVLARAIMELYRNARLAIDHSIGNGFYYDLFTDVPVSESLLSYIKKKMQEIVDKNESFGKKLMTRTEAIALLNREGYPEKARLLKNLNSDKVGIISCWKYIDLDFGPMVPSTGYLEVFDLKQYAKGFVLLFPDNKEPTRPAEIRRQPKIFQAYRESKHWGQILEVNNVGRLNEIIKNKTISDFVKTAEALHSKKIQEVADQITSRCSCRIVLIAGPSSSGKTTFSKRLCTHLKVNGLKPITLSLDNYFLDRAHTPRDEDGEFDFESIYALDLELFNKQLRALLDGQTVQIPEFDFQTGHRKTETDPLRINEDQIIIIEGIHGLNDELTSSIPASCKFKIYISALTQLVIDDYNRIATTDTRLIRRTVRDSKYRGYSALETINRWKSVRRGEERNIFPFQECADMVFNSAVPYEWAVLRPLAEPLFMDIQPDSTAFPLARKILRTLSFFSTLDPKEVPPTSILREFIGGSSFQY